MKEKRSGDTLGWIVVEPGTRVRKHYEVAAWWTLLELEPGRYPVVARGISCLDDPVPYWAMVSIPGTIVEEFFPSLFGGVAYGLPDPSKNAGREDRYSMQMYAYQWKEEHEEVLQGERS